MDALRDRREEFGLTGFFAPKRGSKIQLSDRATVRETAPFFFSEQDYSKLYGRVRA